MPLFRGLSAFPITPTDQAGVVVSALEVILNRVREAGADSIGLLGSTGGYAFLSHEQRRRDGDGRWEDTRDRRCRRPSDG